MFVNTVECVQVTHSPHEVDLLASIFVKAGTSLSHDGYVEGDNLLTTAEQSFIGEYLDLTGAARHAIDAADPETAIPVNGRTTTSRKR